MRYSSHSFDPYLRLCDVPFPSYPLFIGYVKTKVVRSLPATTSACLDYEISSPDTAIVNQLAVMR